MVKTTEKWSQDLLADEKHSRHQGQKVYITTTVGQECILGADLADWELCHNAPHFKMTFAYPSAQHTSNMLDRLMNYQDRLLYAMQYFHGHQESARLYIRAMALLWNFHPYGQKMQAKYEATGLTPFERLNGFRYHDNWLHNFLIAASLGGHPG